MEWWIRVAGRRGEGTSLLGLQVVEAGMLGYLLMAVKGEGGKGVDLF